MPQIRHTVDQFVKAPLGRAVERAGVWFYNNIFYPSEFGLREIKYNPNVHGPYTPWRYYGKLDKPFMEVKLCDLKSWYGRRERSPKAFYLLLQRSWWRWNWNFNTSGHFQRMAIYYQFMIMYSLMWTLIFYDRALLFRHYRYHW